VLMDIGMPELNGLEATRRIKAVEPQVKVLVITVHDEHSYRQAAMAAGADAYIIKKELPDRLAAALEVATSGGS
jgi:DNA-binding NarL/FixJ family response regulator